ncbi:MAG: HAD-IC family P-type ATPase, partial [Clostridia bacterium]|nr:HAD-IC family P-type ATPase [Clostridia bacterium]
RGVQGVYQNESCLGGTAAFLQEAGIDLSDVQKSAEQLQQEGNTVLYFSSGSRLVGCLAVADEIRKESRTAIEELKKQGIRTVLLTGDHPSVANAVAREIGVDEVIAQVMPADKEAVVRHEQEKGHRVLMAGDGINDSPALARADLGCAMGGGTEIAMESADMVLLHDDPRDIPRQIAYSKCTMRNIRQNLFWAFFYNTLGIPVAAGVLFPAFGVVLNPMIGAAAMSLSSLFVVTNALRLYRGK